jgi:hypothetical protein
MELFSFVIMSTLNVCDVSIPQEDLERINKQEEISIKRCKDKYYNKDSFMYAKCFAKEKEIATELRGIKLSEIKKKCHSSQSILKKKIFNDKKLTNSIFSAWRCYELLVFLVIMNKLDEFSDKDPSYVTLSKNLFKTSNEINEAIMKKKQIEFIADCKESKVLIHVPCIGSYLDGIDPQISCNNELYTVLDEYSRRRPRRDGHFP